MAPAFFYSSSISISYIPLMRNTLYVFPSPYFSSSCSFDDICHIITIVSMLGVALPVSIRLYAALVIPSISAISFWLSLCFSLHSFGVFVTAHLISNYRPSFFDRICHQFYISDLLYWALCCPPVFISYLIQFFMALCCCY